MELINWPAMQSGFQKLGHISYHLLGAVNFSYQNTALIVNRSWINVTSIDIDKRLPFIFITKNKSDRIKLFNIHFKILMHQISNYISNISLTVPILVRYFVTINLIYKTTRNPKLFWKRGPMWPIYICWYLFSGHCISRITLTRQDR